MVYILSEDDSIAYLEGGWEQFDVEERIVEELIRREGFPGVLEKFLAVDFNYLYMKALQTHKRHGLWA